MNIQKLLLYTLPQHGNGSKRTASKLALCKIELRGIHFGHNLPLMDMNHFLSLITYHRPTRTAGPYALLTQATTDQQSALVQARSLVAIDNIAV